MENPEIDGVEIGREHCKAANPSESPGISRIDRILANIRNYLNSLERADADRSIANIERSRDRILQRAERLQQQ
jgi:hypothetical protein